MSVWTLRFQSICFLYCRLFIIVKLYFAYAIFASYLLQFYVPMDFLEPSFFDLIKTDRLPYYFPRYHEQIKAGIQYAFRTVLVILTGEQQFYVVVMHEMIMPLMG